jgi:hypothetical protein
MGMNEPAVIFDQRQGRDFQWILRVKINESQRRFIVEVCGFFMDKNGVGARLA